MMDNAFTLVQARDAMTVSGKLPFWDPELIAGIPEGATILALPPDYKGGHTIDLAVAENTAYYILVGENAEVIIKEQGQLEGTVTLHLAPQAKVTYLCQPLSNQAEEVIQQRQAYLADHAQIDWFGGFVAIAQLKTKICSFLCGRNAQSNMHFMLLSSQDDQANFTFANNFMAENVQGEMYIHTVAQDRARVMVRGEINIGETANGTDSYLKEDTLLLDAEARVRALPCLEIKTNDVKAGHGATVTNVTDEHLFYVMSRGITRSKARSMMVRGFLESVLTKCAVPEYVDECLAALEGAVV